VALTMLHSEHNHELDPSIVNKTARKYLQLSTEVVEQIDKYVQHWAFNFHK